MPLVFHNGNWTIEVIRSVMPGHLTGRITHDTSGHRYVFTVTGKSVRYMREYKPPTNIPKYMDTYLADLVGVLLKGEADAPLRRRF